MHALCLNNRYASPRQCTAQQPLNEEFEQLSTGLYCLFNSLSDLCYLGAT
jgi:hypothetical protein